MFRASDKWLRDYYICCQCGSIPRQRHVQVVLDERFVGWEQFKIHESSPSSNFIERYGADYHSSQYLPGVPLGESRDGVRCENLEALTFPDESFDLFVTQDVMEHVLDPEKAIVEIQRVLRPGGAHVFTAPRHRNLEITRQRARQESDDSITYLEEPEYHGNPVGDGRALVTYDYGQDFEQLLSTWSGGTVQVCHTLDRSRGLDAEFNEVFVIGKAPYPVAAPTLARMLDEQITPLQSQISELMASTSWRATRPLRQATDAARALRERARRHGST